MGVDRKVGTAAGNCCTIAALLLHYEAKLEIVVVVAETVGRVCAACKSFYWSLVCTDPLLKNVEIGRREQKTIIVEW